MPRMRDEAGFRFGIGHALLIGALLVAGALELDPLTALGLVFLAALVAGLGLGPGWRAGLAISAWAMFTGFVENRFGILTFAPADLVRLGLLVLGCGLLAGPVARTRTRVHR